MQFFEDLSQTHAHLLAEKVGRAAVQLACVLSQIIEQFCGLNTGNAAVTEAKIIVFVCNIVYEHSFQADHKEMIHKSCGLKPAAGDEVISPR